MTPIFQYQQLTQLWLSLKAMKNTDDVFRYLDDYFKHDTTIEGTIAHNHMQTYYLVGYTTGEKRLTLTFTLRVQSSSERLPTPRATVPTEVAHVAINLTPETFYTALQSTERFMSLFY